MRKWFVYPVGGGRMSERPWFKFWPKALSRGLDCPRVPLYDLVETSAKRFPDKDAIIYYGTRIKYDELWGDVENFAGLLSDLGVEKGERVALFDANSPQWVIAYFGTLRANAVSVPINPLLKADELRYILNDSGAKVIATSLPFVFTVAEAVKDTQVEKIIVYKHRDYIPAEPEIPAPDFLMLDAKIPDTMVDWGKAMSEEHSPPEEKSKHEDLAMIVYTSGTTGVPKGCMHPHRTVYFNAIASSYWFRTTTQGVNLAVLPYFHVTGLQHSLNAALYAGGTVVLFTRWDRRAALQAIEKYRCTHWVSIATMVVDFINDPEVTKFDLSSLIVAGGGGAPMPQAVAERFRELTGITYAEGYGLTETISQTHLNPLERPKLQCLGIPEFNTDSLVVDLETGDVLAPGETGEIVVKGPQVFLGYWNKPKETEEAFIEIDGEKYFRTGDVGYMDEEGYFFMVDRVKRMINRAGFKVWPTEVENIMYGHPAIKEICIVGVPDERVVEEVKAYVVLKPEYEGKVKPEEIIEWAKGKMAAYKYPRIVEFVSDLPKSATGKVLWRELQEKERAGKAG